MFQKSNFLSSHPLYKKTLSIPTPEWIGQTWMQYEVEYIVWDKKNDPEWQLEQYPFLKGVAVFGDLAIYQFSSDDMKGNN